MRSAETRKVNVLEMECLKSLDPPREQWMDYMYRLSSFYNSFTTCLLRGVATAKGEGKASPSNS